MALSPTRHPGGSSASFLTLPPPTITYSGCSAAMRRAITSATCCRHFFCPAARSRGLHVVFEGAPFVRQMAKLHGFHDAVHDHGGTEAGPQPGNSILPTLIAPRACIAASFTTLTGHETHCKVKAHINPRPETRVRKRSIVDDRRDSRSLPRRTSSPGKLLDADDHLLGGQRGRRNLRGSSWPVARILTVVPPTSTTSTFMVTPSSQQTL